VERATGIGGVFVRSPRPDALRAWYAEHLGLELQEFGGAVLTSSGGETLTFGWATDPDGNRFELWEPPPGY
jgi:catechol 2,3-dioxygenase-like lactoylglutathione lyase family enzyme